jgi:Uma2 family endonuclease
MSKASHTPSFPTPPPGEDALPFSDGEPVDSERHAKQQTLLTSSLDRAWEDRSDVYVGGNMFVYFSHLQAKQNDFRGPDVFVVLDTSRRERKSWVVWEEAGRTPDVVIELLSASTEGVDRGDKMRIYAKLLRVSNYYLFDPVTGLLEGYQLDPNTRTYQRMAPLPCHVDAHRTDPQTPGDLPCPALGLCLGVRHGRYQGLELDWLRWIDADGRVLPTAEEDAEEAERRLSEALTEIERLKKERGG